MAILGIFVSGMRNDRSEHFSQPDFYGWVKEQLREKGDAGSITQLANKLGKAYQNLSSALNSGGKGKPIRPDKETIAQIAQALIEMDIISNADEAWLAAGYQSAEYVTLPKSKLPVCSANNDKIVYEPIFDGLRSASYSGGLDADDVDEIAALIRLKAQRLARKRGAD